MKSGKVSFKQGSSPRMRGALYESVKPADYAGIIPADAGSTSTRKTRRRKATDHPRGCGEHRFPFVAIVPV